MCKPGRYKLKILGGGNLNIINQQGEPQKGGTKFLKFSRGKQNGWDTIFDLNLVGRKSWRKPCFSRNVFNIKNRYAFPSVFNAVPVGFKIMIVVVSFTLFENCRKHVSVVFIFLMIPFFYLRIFCSHESCF